MRVQSVRPIQTNAFKDLFVPVVRTSQDEAAIAVADKIAAHADGRFTALLAQPLPVEFFAADPLGSGDLWGVILAELKAEGEHEAERLKTRLAKVTSRADFRTAPLEYFLTQETAVSLARHSDLTIMPAPRGDADRAFRSELLENILFQSGRPVLIVPANYQKSTAFERIVIGWNASREAARAVGDAASLIDAAKNVTIVTVDAKTNDWNVGAASGADLAAHLLHRGVAAEVRNLVSGGRPEAEVLLDTAAGLSANLIVLGGYGHSRARELILGGVTRDILRLADRPVFMSH